MTNININGIPCRSLVDTGCQRTVVTSKVVDALGAKHNSVPHSVTMLDGKTTICVGEVDLLLQTESGSVKLRCFVSPSLVCGFSAIVGMDAVRGLGGVSVSPLSVPRFGSVNQGEQLSFVAAAGISVSSTLEVDDTDFKACFDGKSWKVSWKWKTGEPVLTNQCGEYKISNGCRSEFEKEVESWIECGWLVEHDKSVHGEVRGVIPLLAAFQPNKERKVRPVLDYGKELNQHINSNPGLDVAVCQDKLREWRKFGSNCCMLDLKKAYLQLYVDNELLKFQAVRFKGKLYVMTRMGFGLNVAPKIMSKVLSKVLSMDPKVAEGTDHYIDDIIVDEDKVSVESVRNHLLSYGLVTKEPERICDARVLGLRVRKDHNDSLVWSRDNDIGDVDSVQTKRELFSVCGRLTGHYPVGGWLRVACSFMKRQTNDCDWDDRIPESVKTMLSETKALLEERDPVSGVWSVPDKKEGVIWCDASSLAVGVAVEVDGRIVEDGCWLRKDDGNHINIAELEAVVRGLSCGIKWHLKSMRVMTDSATVFGWVNSVIHDSKRPKVNGLGEMLTRRRLSMISELISLYELSVEIVLVRSEENIADALTRVPKRWLKPPVAVLSVGCVSSYSIEAIRDLHDTHHLGVERTFYLSRLKWGDATMKEDVERVVRECQVCRRIDPAPVRWENSELSVEETWARLASDVTHHEGVPYLTLVDCGPSRFCVWRQMRNETAETAVKLLEQIFYERGPPKELLTDNGPCFRSEAFRKFMTKWNVDHIFSCAYRHQGNGIAERQHRTIKRMVARTGRSLQEMLFWHNFSTKSGDTTPAESVYRYKSRSLPEIAGNSFKQQRDTHLNPFSVGDMVFIKPPNAKCTTTWTIGKVTGLISSTAVMVGSTPRHISDLRICQTMEGSNKNDPPTITIYSDSDIWENENQSDGELENNDNVNNEVSDADPDQARTARTRKPPARYGNNVYDV